MLKNIFKFAWRNIWRNKRRTALTLLALVIGISCVVFARSYVAGLMNTVTESLVKMQTGHVRIAHKEYLRMERILPKEFMVEGSEKINTALQKDKEIDMRLFSQRVKFHVMMSHGDYNESGIAVGIDTMAEEKNLKLSGSIVSGSYFKGEDPGLNMIIGSKLAKKLNLKVNDELLLVTTDINFSTYALPFNVAGIYETGFSTMDKLMLYIPLKHARKMLDCGTASHDVLVYLNDPSKAVAAAKKIKAMIGAEAGGGEISVVPWQEDGMIADTLPMMQSVYGKMLGIIILVVALVILNTMLMAVMERYHEIGVMKAMGFKNRESFMMIMVEALYIGVIGSLTGGILGGSFAAYLEKTGFDFSKMMDETVMEKVDMPIPIFGTMLYPDFSAVIFVTSVIFGIIVTLLAVIYPAMKSSRMQPVDAFRSQLSI